VARGPTKPKPSSASMSSPSDVLDDLKPSEQAVLERMAARQKDKPPRPRMKVAEKGQLGFDHRDPTVGLALMAEALGSDDPDFIYPLMVQLTNAMSVGQDVDAAALNFGRGGVLRHALAAAVERANHELGLAEALISGLAAPDEGERVILWRPLAPVVHHSEASLRDGVPMIGQRPQQLQRRCVVAPIIRTPPIL